MLMEQTAMVAISMFGAMFTWMMIFVTHLYFRRAHAGEPLAFRSWGYPYSGLLGAGLMAAILLTTPFTREFRMTLIYGLPALALLYAALPQHSMHSPEPPHVWHEGNAAVSLRFCPVPKHCVLRSSELP